MAYKVPAAVNSIKKTGLDPALTGAVTLSEGANVTLTQLNQDISIAATIPAVVYPRTIQMLSSGVTIPSDGTTYEYGQIIFFPIMIGAGQFVRFCATARLGDATKTGTISLYDLTEGVLITGGSLAISNPTTAYQYHETAALPVGEDPGEIHPVDDHYYAAHLTCAGTNGALEVLIPSNIYLEIY